MDEIRIDDPAVNGIAVSDATAAALLGVSRRHFRRMVADGRAPNPVKLGRSSRWRVAELRAWIDAGCPPRWRWTWPRPAA